MVQRVSGTSLDPSTRGHSRPDPKTVSILVADQTKARALRETCIRLGLLPLPGSASPPERDFVVADEAAMRGLLGEPHAGRNGMEGRGPVLIYAKPAESELDVDGICTLADDPELAAAQMAGYIDAGRAFARQTPQETPQRELSNRIFASVTNGISIADATDPEMPLEYVNPAFEKMTGYALDEVCGRNCRFLQGTDRDQPGVGAMREALKHGRGAMVLLKNYRKDGSLFWNELSLSPIRNNLGALTHFVGIQSDVTERVNFEAALRESEKLAAVGRLSAAVTHEINNPLSAIMNLTFLAQTCAMEARAREYLREADEWLQRVSLITTQSLSFYRQSSEPQAVSTPNLLTSVLEVHQRHFSKADVTIERRDRTGASIICLESEIRQVLSNLVRNAVDAMGENGGRLLVRSRQATAWRSGEAGVVITVADTGEGIHRDALQKIYTAFFSTKGSEGTGLGLWVSAGIVERHRGHLRVRSRRHHQQSGTVFQLFLPYRAAA